MTTNLSSRFLRTLAFAPVLLAAAATGTAFADTGAVHSRAFTDASSATQPGREAPATGTAFGRAVRSADGPTGFGRDGAGVNGSVAVRADIPVAERIGRAAPLSHPSAASTHAATRAGNAGDRS